MRVAFLTSEYVSEANFDGGLANYLRRVSITLMEQGHQVEIFTESTVDETIEHDGIIVHRIRPPETTVNWIRRMTRYYYSQAAMMILPMALKMRRRVLRRHREAPFDLVQSANLQSLGLGLVHFSPFPVVVRASSYQPYWREYDRLRPYRPSRSTLMVDRFERYMVRHAAAAYAPSELIASAFRQIVRPDFAVIHTPFLLDNITPDDSFYRENLTGFRYLLYFGTIKVLKGGITLGDALKNILPQFQDMHIVLVGKDMPIKDDVHEPQHTVLQHIIEQAGEHADRVHHVGRLHHEALYPIIENAEGVVLPSRIDNFPNTCLEAMAMGKVVIGTRGASFDEMMEDDVSGILVPKDDPTALADAMGRLWQMSDEKKKRLGEAAKARVKPLEPDTACRILEEYFQKHLQPG